MAAHASDAGLPSPGRHRIVRAVRGGGDDDLRGSPRGLQALEHPNQQRLAGERHQHLAREAEWSRCAPERRPEPSRASSGTDGKSRAPSSAGTVRRAAKPSGPRARRDCPASEVPSVLGVRGLGVPRPRVATRTSSRLGAHRAEALGDESNGWGVGLGIGVRRSPSSLACGPGRGGGLADPAGRGGDPGCRARRGPERRRGASGRCRTGRRVSTRRRPSGRRVGLRRGRPRIPESVTLGAAEPDRGPAERAACTTASSRPGTAEPDSDISMRRPTTTVTPWGGRWRGSTSATSGT